MTLRTRPLHCKFETLRLAVDAGRSTHPYNRSSFAAFEQVSARNTERMVRCAKAASRMPPIFGL
ncbi:hypothetical protein FE840_010305 [Peteryoungia desertarenae]|uniref:Uncharacterized protein n=1 Tax=Peteryoungia desertarenae TaxID=1813451 RepID=A0ABX6QSC3_9HYPH|nr:hypothetical protein [Peteryoungia desertarenae]QLF71368.1 hypothetical protein FE840_010305 [Peteryoungia desertarenae]